MMSRDFFRVPFLSLSLLFSSTSFASDPAISLLGAAAKWAIEKVAPIALAFAANQVGYNYNSWDPHTNTFDPNNSSTYQNRGLERSPEESVGEKKRGYEQKTSTKLSVANPDSFSHKYVPTKEEFEVAPYLDPELCPADPRFNKAKADSFIKKQTELQQKAQREASEKRIEKIQKEIDDAYSKGLVLHQDEVKRFADNIKRYCVNHQSNETKAIWDILENNNQKDIKIILDSGHIVSEVNADVIERIRTEAKPDISKLPLLLNNDFQDMKPRRPKESDERKPNQDPDPRQKDVKFITFPERDKPGKHKHVWRYEDDHILEDTPKAREVMQNAFKHGKHLGQDAFDNHHYVWINPEDGNQIWLKIRPCGKLMDGGASIPGRHWINHPKTNFLVEPANLTPLAKGIKSVVKYGVTGLVVGSALQYAKGASGLQEWEDEWKQQLMVDVEEGIKKHAERKIELRKEMGSSLDLHRAREAELVHQHRFSKNSQSVKLKVTGDQIKRVNNALEGKRIYYNKPEKSASEESTSVGDKAAGWDKSSDGRSSTIRF